MAFVLQLLGGMAAVLVGIGIFGALSMEDLVAHPGEPARRSAKMAFSAAAFLVAGGLATLFGLIA